MDLRAGQQVIARAPPRWSPQYVVFHRSPCSEKISSIAITFARGACENPDEPQQDDDFDTTILVVTAPDHLESARRALERCAVRWRGIDGDGRHHGDDDAELTVSPVAGEQVLRARCAQ